jgi:hypothetical protein
MDPSRVVGAGVPVFKAISFFGTVLLAREGLELVDLLAQDGIEARQRYLTRRDGSIAFPIPLYNSGNPTQAGWVREAVVPRR